MTIMDDIRLVPPSPGSPITEADLHAFVDAQLTPTRRAEVAQYLAERPDEAARVESWRQHRQLLHGLFDPVLDEPLPARLMLRPSATVLPWRGFAAGLAIAVLSAGTAWTVRGSLDAQAARLASADAAPRDAIVTAVGPSLSGFALRAAVAHVVYSPDVRRPVEVGADQEQQLVAWLSKRLGTQVKPPSLDAIGYELIGGRLLPGETGPVAQFMYHDAGGQRMTLYVTHESARPAGKPETSFHFGQDGGVKVFYWVDRNFGYAISGGVDRQALLRVANEVYRQLAPT